MMEEENTIEIDPDEKRLVVKSIRDATILHLVAVLFYSFVFFFALHALLMYFVFEKELGFFLTGMMLFAVIMFGAWLMVIIAQIKIAYNIRKFLDHNSVKRLTRFSTTRSIQIICIILLILFPLALYGEFNDTLSMMLFMVMFPIAIFLFIFNNQLLLVDRNWRSYAAAFTSANMVFCVFVMTLVDDYSEWLVGLLIAISVLLLISNILMLINIDHLIHKKELMEEDKEGEGDALDKKLHLTFLLMGIILFLGLIFELAILSLGMFSKILMINTIVVAIIDSILLFRFTRKVFPKFVFKPLRTVSIVVFALLIMTTVSSTMMVFDYYSGRTYDIDILREVDNETEERMLEIAERGYYTSMLNRTRYFGGDMELSRVEQEDPRYIDGTVVDDLVDVVKYSKERSKRGHYNVDYEASVTYIDEMTISLQMNEYDHPMLNFETKADIFDRNYHYERYFESGDIFYYQNGTQFEIFNYSRYDDHTKKIDLDLNYSNCYGVHMELDYSFGGWGGTEMEQFVVIDENEDIIALFLTSSVWEV